MADFLSFIDPACCVLNFHTASVELPVCLLQAVLQKLSNASRNSTGPCSAGDGCSTRRHNFGRGGCGCAAGDWGAALAKLVSAGERNLGNFLSLSKTGLKQAVLLTDTGILTFLGMLIALAVAAPRLSWSRHVHFVI